MRQLAQSLADTFGISVSYPDSAGRRQTTQPWKTDAQAKRRAERQLDRQRQQQRAAKRGVAK